MFQYLQAKICPREEHFSIPPYCILLASLRTSTVVNWQLCVCMCVCVRVCVLILFHRNGFFRLQRCLGHTWGVRINDLAMWVSFQLLLPSSFISISENINIHLQRRDSSTPITGEKTILYIAPRKDDMYWYGI